MTEIAELREDYALVRVPAEASRPGVWGLFGIVLGIPSAIVFLSLGGTLENAYGTWPLVSALVVASVLIGGASWILTSYASRTGLDSDLMSIHAGFGRLGSGFTSLIYSANFVVLFAIEDSIVAGAVHAYYPSLPREAVLVAAGMVVLLLTWLGVTGMSVIMRLTLPVFAILLGIACLRAGQRHPVAGFWSASGAAPRLGPAEWLGMLSALLAFIVNATVAADIGRFLPERRRRLGAFLFGVVLQVASFVGATLLGAWFAHQMGGLADPSQYLVSLLGGWGVLYVLITQMRINMINTYSGSLSLSNFGARGLGLRPGRHVWMFLLASLGTILAFGDIYSHLLGVLTFEAVFVMAWVATLVTYILTHGPASDKKLPSMDDAPAVNWTGLFGLLLALMVSTPLAFGALDDIGKGLAPVVAAVVAPIGVAISRQLLPRARPSTSVSRN